MNRAFLVWVFLFLLAPIAGVWGLVSSRRRARRELEDEKELERQRSQALPPSL